MDHNKLMEKSVLNVKEMKKKKRKQITHLNLIMLSSKIQMESVNGYAMIA